MTELEQGLAWLDADDHAVRKQGVELLRKLGDDAIPPLIDLACSYKVVARMRAIEALGELGDPDAFWPLANLGHELLLTRRKAMQAIVEHVAETPTREDAAWLIGIIKTFRRDPQGQELVQAAAQGALNLARRAPCPELAPLLPLLTDELEDLRHELKRHLAPYKDLPRIADSPEKRSADLPRPASR